MATRKKAPRQRVRGKAAKKRTKKAPRRRSAKPRPPDSPPWAGKLRGVLEQIEADPEAALAKAEKLGAVGAALLRRANTHPQEAAQAVKPAALRMLAKILKQNLP